MFINDVDFAPVAFYLIPKIFVRKYFIVSNDCMSNSYLQCALHSGLFMHISCSNPWSWDKLILFLHIIFQPSSGENTYSCHQAFTRSFSYIFYLFDCPHQQTTKTQQYSNNTSTQVQKPILNNKFLHLMPKPALVFLV